jgi:hypothetical protein
MPIEVVDLPSYKMVDLSSSFFVCLPSANPSHNQSTVEEFAERLMAQIIAERWEENLRIALMGTFLIDLTICVPTSHGIARPSHIHEILGWV